MESRIQLAKKGFLAAMLYPITLREAGLPTH